MGPLLAIALDLAVVAPRTDDGCTVRAAQADLQVEVRPEGVAPFRVALERQELAVSLPTERGRAAAVDVRGPLLFRGGAAEVTFIAARPVESVGGMVRLGSAAEASSERLVARGASAVGSFQVDGGVRASAIEVPCSGLTLDSVHRVWPAVREEPSPELAWLPRRSRLTLRERPADGKQVVLTFDEPGSFYLGQLAADGEWLRVEWTGGGGGRVRGWARRGDLRGLPNGIGLQGISGSSCCRGGCGRGRTLGIGIYNGPAEVKGGAQVFALEELRGRWATVRATARFEVAYHLGDPYVEVREVPGIDESCGALKHAFVARGDVVLPGGVVESLEREMPHATVGR